MGEDVRIIKLRREAIDDDKREVAENAGEKEYFSLDYFDTLRVEKKQITDMFAVIMNLRETDLTDGKQIAVQSYSIYYSQNMWEKYEENQSGTHGNPFEDENGFGYLSIVLVHITPEALRRMQYEVRDLWGEDIILEPFIDDLYDIVDGYAKKYINEQLVYRVYQVLSMGDLAVVIKSKRSETSFKISSQIRKRVAGIKVQDAIKRSAWSLYKTYTLLAIDRDIETKGAEDCERNGKVMIRGEYSCKYWTEYKATEKNRPNGVLGLTGRYDFSVEILETEFLRYLYPYILRIKNGKKSNERKQISGEASEEVKYLSWLIENGYLSYVNERYLLSGGDMEESADENTVSRYVLLRENTSDIAKLRESNNCYVNELLSNYETIEKKLAKMQDTHKNLEQYLLLLKKLIISCNMINELPDTRVYVFGMGKQIEAVMNSLEMYCNLYEQIGEAVDYMEQKDKDEIAELMVDYLREAVYAMDSYAQYVRNNNLQSLQTPNYNIESNMGMEKLLIGYSEYLSEFIKYYEQYFMKEQLEESMKEVVPVLIPDLHSTDMHVEILFPEGNGSDWRKEETLREQLDKKNKYLLVIDSPTLAELGDMPIFMAMLFHELAHQFRYEKREERNSNLLHAITREIACAIARKVAHKLETQMKLYDFFSDPIYVLSKVWIEPLWEQINNMYNVGDSHADKEDERKSPLDMPLNYFERDISKKLDIFSRAWTNGEKLEEKFKHYVEQLQLYCNWCSQDNMWYIELAHDILFHNQDDQHAYETETLYITRVEKIACVLAWRTAYEKADIQRRSSLSKGKFILQRSATIKWCMDAESVCMDEICGEIKAVGEGSENENAIKHIYKLVVNFIFELEQEYKNWYEQSTNIRNFFEKVYQKLCHEWEQQMQKLRNQKVEVPEASARSWMLVGRHWGIDYNMDVNQDAFCKKIIEECEDLFDVGQIYNLIGIYRETTSDIFMGKMMKLSPFGYLNLVTLSIPESILEPGLNLQRISYVIYILAGQKCEDIDSIEEYHEQICNDLLRALEIYYNSCFEGHTNSLGYNR